MEYDGFKAVCTGAKDSDSPCFIIIQGEKGYMKIDGKPNSVTNLKTVLIGSDEGEYYLEEPRHRMTREFADFAEMIDNKDHQRAEYYERETLEVMRIVSSIV
jgi:hypothetical protein